MGKSKDKASREAKADKKLALGLGVKRKQLKRKKDRVLDGAVESEGAAGHAIVEGVGRDFLLLVPTIPFWVLLQNQWLRLKPRAKDKKLVRSKKIALMKQKKKNKHVKVTSSHTEVELLSDSKDEATPKLKKQKNKKKQREGTSPVEVHTSPSNSNDVGTLKLKKKKRKVKEGKISVEPNDAKDILHENQDEETSADVNQFAAQTEVMNIGDPEKAKRGKKNKTKKVQQSREVTKMDMPASSEENKLGRHGEVDTANVDEIPSVDEDCSRGMKKWILEYKQKRPGLKVLQQRIDEFITSHEEQQEQERKEREARAAEDGWTVVVHHKGRKKTTDTETGTAVGSVSLAAMQGKISKKKPKEIGLNFYRFQKREAQITELAMLQSKFEQDKKRIQQLRAQRKFKPY